MSDYTIIFSKDRKYRYSFHKTWSEAPSIMFIGLNPSMSDGLNPTLRRCITFAQIWGYGSCYILNLFACRTKNPSLLKKIISPVGEENDIYILCTAAKVDKVVFAWGTHGGYLNRDQAVIDLLGQSYTFGLTKKGFPRHPLYVRSNTPLIPFNT